MSKLVASTPFINVSIKIRPDHITGSYKVETAPAILRVTQPDTIINYQIVDSGEQNIVFNKNNPMTVTPSDNNQLSLPSVGITGKLLTFSDANSVAMTLKILLHFVDEKGVEFKHDPEVSNDPQR
ncbi:hypothetical protein [Duganella sacchari]|uniref:hypothetical protein n=1 Tax=Duganella sacchari TaxID=551987 RepID=UPI00111476A7|nr:hypothetical protein [Duganella sacchari]